MSETLIFEDDIGTAYEDEPSVDPDDATVVLAEQTLTFNGTDQLIIEMSSPLVVGRTYRVMWDGTAYTSTAADLEGVVFIGNAAFSGLDGASDTGEPFAIAYFDGECAIFTLDAGDHTVAIYQEVEDVHASNDAVILSYSQNPVEYKAVPKVWLTHPDSTEEAPVLVPFTYGELLEDVEIMPDFAEGDMQISVPDGSLVKEATIIKPEDLTPENIRKGVTIGGIEGEFLGDTGAEAEEVTVDLDFSEGDMVIAPEEDKVFSTVKIPKPDTLTPENIAKGVEIAGIVGTLAVSNAAIEIYQKQLSMSLSSASSKQSTALLLAASDLPEWWPAAGSMVAHSYGSYNPIYIVLLVRISGRGGQYYLQSAMISNFTGSPSYPAMAGYLVAKSNGYNGFNGVNSRYWNYTTPSGYNGLFQNTSGICLGSYNEFCQCSGTYKLILLKINPYA